MNDADEYLKKEIIEQSRHQFIYGKHNNRRKCLIDEIVHDYPVIRDENRPMAIYLDSIGLPKKDDFNKDKITTISREYLYFSIADNILKSSSNILVDDKLERLFFILNRYFVNHNFEEIKNINKLHSYIKDSKDFYLNGYLNGVINDISSIALPFFQIDLFIEEYKKALNNNSYFGIIVDNKYDINSYSIRSLNDLIGSRINKDISMKIFTDPEDWPSYVDSNGNLVQLVHDYGTVEIDNSYSESIKKIMMRYE